MVEPRKSAIEFDVDSRLAQKSAIAFVAVAIYGVFTPVQCQWIGGLRHMLKWKQRERLCGVHTAWKY